MKKLTTSLLLCASLAAFSVVADELPDAPKDVLMELSDSCKEWAEEDKVESDKLTSFLLGCINDELTNLGYKNIESLDQVN